MHSCARVEYTGLHRVGWWLEMVSMRRSVAGSAAVLRHCDSRVPARALVAFELWCSARCSSDAVGFNLSIGHDREASCIRVRVLNTSACNVWADDLRRAR